jgi:hypothetical protein
MIKADTVTPIVITITMLIIGIFLWRKWKRDRELKGWHFVILFVVPIALGIGVGLTITSIQKPAALSFQNSIPAYKALQASQPAEPYLRGKVVIIEKNKDKLHDTYYKLPKDLQAKNADEVSTVVILRCGGKVRVYQVFGTKRTPIYDSSSCDADIIDWTVPALIYTYHASKLGGTPELMAEDVLDYLLTLPRKEAGA